MLNILALLVLLSLYYSNSWIILGSKPIYSLVKALSDENIDDRILRKIDKWACVKNCGACCKLGPLETRPDLEDYLDKDQLNMYKSMIGECTGANFY